MKIIVNSPLMRDKIIQAVDGYKKGDVEIKFISQQGISVTFEVIGLEGTAAIDLVKSIIKSQEFGKVLYFQVTA